MSVVTLMRPLDRDLALLGDEAYFRRYHASLRESADRSTKWLKTLEDMEQIVRQQPVSLVLDKLLDSIPQLLQEEALV